jgi:hypothetical protein
VLGTFGSQLIVVSSDLLAAGGGVENAVGIYPYPNNDVSGYFCIRMSPQAGRIWHSISAIDQGRVVGQRLPPW